MKHATVSLLAACALLVGCGEPSPDAAKQKAYATELLNRGLYAEAVEAYDRYIEMPGVSDEERANVLYHSANALFDKAKDYHGALVRYLKLKSYYPAFPQMRDVEAKIVQCFERTGRSLEAQLALEQAAHLSRQESSAPPAREVVVAEVGSRKITQQDLLRELERFPPDVRGQFESTDGKRLLLRQVVGREVLYDTAVRRGYLNDPETERTVEQLRRDLLVQKVIDEHLSKQPEVTETEVRLYYEAHKTQFKAPEAATPPPLEQVRPQVEAALRQEKQQEAIEKLLDRALSAEDVRLYPERVR